MRLFLTSLAVFMASPIAVSAQEAQTANAETSAPAEFDAYQDAYAAMTEGLDQDQILDTVMVSVRKSYGEDPTMASLEKKFPGFLDDLVVVMRPVMVSHTERLTVEYEPRFVQVFRDMFTPAQAANVAAFYRSPLGQKLVGGVVENFNADSSIESAVAQESVTEATVRKDLEKTAEAAMSAMTRDDFIEMGKLAAKQPELLQLATLGEKMLPIRVAMESEPMSEADTENLTSIMRSLVQSY